MAQASLDSLRLYGVAASEARHHDSLAEGTSIVEFRALSAVVSQSRYERVAQSPEELGAYMKVVQEVYAQTPLLPAPPGTVFRSEETLLRWMELHYFSLLEGLGKVEGHSSARVTLTAKALPEAAEALKLLHATAAESMRALRGQAAATVSHQADEDNAQAIATASFMIETGHWSVFGDVVAAEAKRHPEFEYRLTGPWPPYEFVQMQFGG